MQEERRLTADRLRPFGSTIFAEMSALAQETQAINLSQGFPDFQGPDRLISAAIEAMQQGHNQYARSEGAPPLVQAITDHRRHFYNLDYDPNTEVGVYCGATEAIAACVLGLLNAGDEVIMFEPYYDSYPACLAMTDATPRFCTLRAPEFRFDSDELEALFSEKTKLIIINSPHNPSGKVFSKDELEHIASLCRQYDVMVLSDEVYEHLVYDDAVHIPIATLPGMKERTVSLSSAGKIFSMTGWIVGWATGPSSMMQAAQAAHQFLTFAVATPFQHAVAAGLKMAIEEDYVSECKRDFTQRRNYLAEALNAAGFEVFLPQGTYFILANFRALYPGNDRDFARILAKDWGVAAIPPSVFYSQEKSAGEHLLRFSFCKKMKTLEQAAIRLRAGAK